MNESISILIVDDDPDDREILKDAFLTNKIEGNYILLESGDALLLHLEQHAQNLPALIIIDLNMPGKDGREALKEIKTHHTFQQIPTVVLTTSSSKQDKTTCYSLGANCFITKPDTFQKLTDLAGSITKLWLQ